MRAKVGALLSCLSSGCLREIELIRATSWSLADTISMLSMGCVMLSTVDPRSYDPLLHEGGIEFILDTQFSGDAAELG